MSLPAMYLIEQRWNHTTLEDVEGTVRAELKRVGLKGRVKPGMSIAITAGSRGIVNMDRTIRTIGEELKALGAKPFIIPAMGSHGGATAEGQRAVLKQLGISDETMGMPIRATMEVVKVGECDGLPVYVDKYAHEADGIIVVNRVKLHTNLNGPIESGLMKMIVIGLGKHETALVAHRFPDVEMTDMVPRMARVSLEKAKIILGVALVENGYDRTHTIEAVAPEQFEKRERALLALSKEMMARIPAEEIDILIVEQMGKNISGAGMDTNVIGMKSPSPGLKREHPIVHTLIVLDLTPETEGSAVGIGFADLTTRKLVEKINYQYTYENLLTAGAAEGGKVPITLADDKEAVEVAMARLHRQTKPEDLRVVQIKDTLHLARLAVSKPLLNVVTSHPHVKIMHPQPIPLKFDSAGNLVSPL